MAKTTGNFSEDELLDMLADTMGNPLELEYSSEDAIRIFTEMKKIDGVNEFFRAVMGRDMRLHWMADGDIKRSNIQGHYAAFAWMRSMMKNIDQQKELVTRKALREAK